MLGNSLDKEFQVGGRLPRLMAYATGFLALTPLLTELVLSLASWRAPVGICPLVVPLASVMGQE